MSEHKPNSVPPPWAGRILTGFFTVCAVFLAIDLFGRPEKHHPIEEWPFIYPFFGFFGIALLIVLAKGLRRLLMRSEDYYDSDQHAGSVDDGNPDT